MTEPSAEKQQRPKRKIIFLIVCAGAVTGGLIVELRHTQRMTVARSRLMQAIQQELRATAESERRQLFYERETAKIKPVAEGYNNVLLQLEAKCKVAKPDPQEVARNLEYIARLRVANPKLADVFELQRWSFGENYVNRTEGIVPRHPHSHDILAANQRLTERIRQLENELQQRDGAKESRSPR
jgi:hypothetical protein